MTKDWTKNLYKIYNYQKKFDLVMETQIRKVYKSIIDGLDPM